MQKRLLDGGPFRCDEWPLTSAELAYGEDDAQ